MSSDARPAATRLVDPELFADVDGEVRLVGSRCNACDAVTFPAQRSCPRCAGEDVSSTHLATTGTLWTYTIQGFPPKTPYLEAHRPFRPYGVGYVDLGGEVLVESRLVTDEPEALRIGMQMQLVLEVLHGDDPDEATVTFAFAPIDDARRGGRT